MSTANASYMLEVEASQRAAAAAAAATAGASSASDMEGGGDGDESGDGVGLPPQFSSPRSGATGASKESPAGESAAAARRRSLASQLARLVEFRT